MAGSTADAAVKRATLHRVGGLAGLLAGPFFLISVGLNTWASLDYLQQLGRDLVGGEQVPWPSSLAVAWIASLAARLMRAGHD